MKIQRPLCSCTWHAGQHYNLIICSEKICSLYTHIFHHIITFLSFGQLQIQFIKFHIHAHLISLEGCFKRLKMAEENRNLDLHVKIWPHYKIVPPYEQKKLIKIQNKCTAVYYHLLFLLFHLLSMVNGTVHRQ